MARNLSYSIIPGASLQFLDYDLDLSVMADGKTLAKKRKPFHLDLEYIQAESGPREKIPLIPLEELEGRPGEYVSRRDGRELPLHFELEYLQAFKVFQNQWLPLPFLVETGAWPDGAPRYGYGPTDWARGYLKQIGPEDSPLFRLTLVFDPVVEPSADGQGQPSGSQVYHTLSEMDVTGNVFFSLAAHERDSAWFIKNLPWIEEALEQSHARYKKEFPRPPLARIAPNAPEHVEAESAGRPGGWSASARMEAQALYLTLLEGLALTKTLRPVRVITPGKTKPIDVDLVLDIGNSRLTGVLVETAPQRATNLTDCYVLQIRDLSDPGRIYAEPLESKVEFSEPFFGRKEWSLASRRHGDSFNWPSAVRLGPEATRLAADSREEKGPTGMSSPKRYLWDNRLRDMEWHLNNSGAPQRGPEEPAVGRGSFLELVNSAGTPLAAFNDPGLRHFRTGGDLVAFEAKYTRSSLMMFLLSEIIAQALTTINSPLVRDNREHPDTPRRLRSLLLTVPTAMPLAEQNIFKTWARLAVETVWEALNWKEHYLPPGASRCGDDFRQSPKVRCDWDEATCTQVVWLYNELHEKFHNNARELFNLLGRKRVLPGGRPEAEGQPVETLRIASIDMGGGTTDLSITTYAIHDPGSATPHIKPHQNFRDGFNVAGDDIMHKIIREHFLKKLAEAAFRAGVADADSHIGNLFKDVAQMGSAGDKAGRVLRAQFIRQVAAPVALNILNQYELADLYGDQTLINIKIGEALGRGEAGQAQIDRVINYLEEPLRQAGWAGFNLLDFSYQIDLKEVDQSVRSVVEKIMTDMGEVIRLYDCDMLLMTGRPSRWPALVLAPFRRLALPPDRVTHMHNYRVGAKYPFVRHGRIEDPKTTVVVGAIICALAEGFLEGLTIDASGFAPRPTARYLGMLDGAGRLSREHVWFNEVDVDNPEEVEMVSAVNFTAPMAVGFRQLSAPRWTTTRLYLLDYSSAQAREQSTGNLPYLLHLRYTLKAAPDEGALRPGQLNKREEGALYIEEALNKHGQPVTKDLTVRLQTLRQDAGYWLDTGAMEDY